MGLAERRATKDFQENIFPELQTALNEAAGFEVNIEVDWSSIAEDGMSHLYDSAWSKVFFNPVVEGFKEICTDNSGSDALKESLTKISLCNASDGYGEEAVSFDNGILKIDHKPFSGIDDEMLRQKAVVCVLEKML